MILKKKTKLDEIQKAKLSIQLGFLIVKQQGSQVPARCIASWMGGVLIIFLPYLLNFIFYISLNKLNIENIIKAIATPVLTVFLTLISFKNILKIKTTTLISKKTTLTLYFKSIYPTSVKL